ncbi:MAG: hypothetical protein GZ091_13595 [Paludibacter sp.]|nr:hypothetical protein [Paludibacter sp.]
MKKNIITLILLISSSLLMAQTEFEALKYMQSDINGTARYMSMAGAFGALGGDASAIKDNPAGLGIYRKSEIIGTMNILKQNSTTNWKYNDGGNLMNSYGYDDLYKLGANNFSMVIASPTWRNESGTEGMLSSNFSFSYNRLKNFDRNFYANSGPSVSSMTDYIANFSEGFNPIDLQYNSSINELFNNNNIPTSSIYGYQGFLMDSVANEKWGSAISNNIMPTYSLSEQGHLDEYSIGWAGNFSNKFYFGATLNYQALNYTAFGTYSETFGSEGNMIIGDTIYTKGNALNLKIGTIFAPTDFLRLGLSIHTPTIFKLSDNYYSTLDYNRTGLDAGKIVAPGNNNAYQLQSPLKVDASVAFIVGTKGLISAEYIYSNNTGTRLLSDEGDNTPFRDENQGMSKVLNNSRTIKIGGEYRLSENFSLRAGYANTNNETKPTAEKYLQLNTVKVNPEYFLHNSTNYLTAGFGYHESGWFIDFAYMNKIIDETFYPYRSVDVANVLVPANVITANNNMVVTLGFKF